MILRHSFVRTLFIPRSVREKLRSIFIYLILLFPFGIAQAIDEWKTAIRDNDSDVVVYHRTLASGDTEFKGITHVKSSLSACVALLRDVDAMPEWVHRTMMAKVLHWVSDTEVYAYNISRTEWPLKTRDAIVHSVLEQDPDSLAVTIKGNSIMSYDGDTLYDYKSNEAQYIRMTKVESFWRFVPQGNGMIEVTFQGYGDPGGNISSPFFKWFLGLVVWESPYETLKKMHEIIGRSKYQTAQFDFIKELNSAGQE